MVRMKSIFFRCTLIHAACVLAELLLTYAPTNAAEPPFPSPASVPEQFKNPWPADWEREYRQRAVHALKMFDDAKFPGGTYGENEKNFYPRAMLGFLNGHRQEALAALQEPDHQTTDHAHTKGVDFYWCFTLKGQARKYFYFGPQLDAAYKQRMFDGAKIWTAQDPLRRHHPVYGKGGRGGVWGPDAKGSWVDVRNTDNLRAMRDTSVYLFAEETANEQTRLLYKEHLTSYVRMLYMVGMSEWDSGNYHSHTLAPYHNLYDFAKDPEVKALAKAALDWLYAAAAVKYYRGGFGGPNCRDYGNSNVVLGDNVTQPLYLYFGDTPQPNPAADRDDVHHITSGYRPPAAVVELARKNFTKPVELFATKPPYELWTPGKFDSPRYFETQYFGRTFQLGTVVSAAPEITWNVSSFKLLAHNSQRGADYFVANTSPLAAHAQKNARDQIGQYRNLAVWLRPAKPETVFYFQVPKTAKAETVGHVWFFANEKTWLAVWPLQLNLAADAPPRSEGATKYAAERFLAARTSGDGYAGFALEVGEAPEFKSFADFRAAVLAKSKLDAASLKQGRVELTSAGGLKLRVEHNAKNDLPLVLRDGSPRDWTTEFDLYRPVPLPGDQKAAETTGPISLGWQQGTLRVEAGGKKFTSTVTLDGKATFENR